MDGSELDLTSYATDIVSAYVGHNAIGADRLPELIGSVYAALSRASVEGGAEPEKAALVPAISVRKSVTPEYIVCLEDGKKFKSLKRHLRTHYDISPDEYRAKWGLAHDYPMVAPAYAAARSNLAKSMGLGRKAKEAALPVERTLPSKPAKKAAQSPRKLNGAPAKNLAK